MKTEREIRKELAIMINDKKQNCKSEKEINNIVNQCRHTMNEKYGYDWRNKFEK